MLRPSELSPSPSPSPSHSEGESGRLSSCGDRGEERKRISTPTTQPPLNTEITQASRLTCVLDFLALALSGSSVSEAPFSRCRLALFIGEGASSLIFCGAKAAETQKVYITEVHARKNEGSATLCCTYFAWLLHGVRLAVGAVSAGCAG